MRALAHGYLQKDWRLGLIILLVIGALLGWLATIALRVEDGRSIFRNVMAGVIGALVAGLVASGGMFLATISATVLLWAIAAAIVLIAIYNLARRKALP